MKYCGYIGDDDKEVEIPTLEEDPDMGLFKVGTVEDLGLLAVANGWKDLDAFLKEHSVTADEVVGFWFQTIRSRIYIMDACQKCGKAHDGELCPEQY